MKSGYDVQSRHFEGRPNMSETTQKKSLSYGALLQNTVGKAARRSSEEKKPARPGTTESIAARFTALQNIAKKGS
jgi:hypothetical protein